MSAPRTADELKAAVDTMFRIRAVESPPDLRGTRKIWHRGARNAELVSEIDVTGRVLRHEFTLFDEVLRWEQGRGFSTGAVEEGGARGAEQIAPDAELNVERLDRVAQALQRYEGRDRIIQHLKDLVGARSAGAPVTEPLRVVTGSHPAVELPAPPPRRTRSVVWIGVGLSLIAIALLLLVLLKQ